MGTDGVIFGAESPLHNLKNLRRQQKKQYQAGLKEKIRFENLYGNREPLTWQKYQAEHGLPVKPVEKSGVVIANQRAQEKIRFENLYGNRESLTWQKYQAEHGLHVKPVEKSGVVIANQGNNSILQALANPRRLNSTTSSLQRIAEDVPFEEIRGGSGRNLPAIINKPASDITKGGFLSKATKFLKGKGGKFALVGAAIAAGVGLYSLLKSDKTEDVKPENNLTEELERVTTPAAGETQEAPETTPEVAQQPTPVVPPVADDSQHNDEVEQTAPVEEESEPAQQPAPVVAPADEDDSENNEEVEEPVEQKPAVKPQVQILPEEEPIQEPIGLESPRGLTVAEMKGQIRENRVENRYLRRDIRLTKRYERRIGTPQEEKPTIEEMQQQIDYNKRETRELRADIKTVRRVEAQERKLERTAQRDIHRLERQAKAQEKKLRKAAQKAQKSGLEFNEEKLESDIKDIQTSTKTKVADIRQNTEQQIAKQRLSLTA